MAPAPTPKPPFDFDECPFCGLAGTGCPSEEEAATCEFFLEQWDKED